MDDSNSDADMIAFGACAAVTQTSYPRVALQRPDQYIEFSHDKTIPPVTLYEYAPVVNTFRTPELHVPIQTQDNGFTADRNMGMSLTATMSTT